MFLGVGFLFKFLVIFFFVSLLLGILGGVINYRLSFLERMPLEQRREWIRQRQKQKARRDARLFAISSWGRLLARSLGYPA